MKSLRKGFTLIELLVVIAVIGILAAVVLASLNSARSKARDVRRKSDLRQVAVALELYKDSYDTYAIPSTGTTGVGTGWFSTYGAPYTKSVAQGLVDAGLMPAAVVDPSGVTSSTSTRAGYMIVSDANGYTLWANLENPSAADTATLATCRSSGYDGYPSANPVSGQTNYCISN